MADLCQGGGGGIVEDARVEISLTSLRVTSAEGEELCRHAIDQLRVWGVAGTSEESKVDGHFAFVAREEGFRDRCYAVRCGGGGVLRAAELARVLRGVALASSGRSSRASAATTTMESNRTGIRFGRERCKGAEKEASTARSRLQCKELSVQDRLPALDASPKLRFRGLDYLGHVQVHRPCGIEVVHGAIEILSTTRRRSRERNDEKTQDQQCQEMQEQDETMTTTTKVCLLLSPAELTMECDDGSTRRDWRVSRLTFFGMSEEEPSLVAFVAAGEGEEGFTAHAFDCGSAASSAELCRALEAACEERFRRKLKVEEASARARRKKASAVRRFINRWTRRGRDRQSF